MFEKETRLKIEWQDPKTMRDLDTHVCCPRRWIMLASTYWTCLSTLLFIQLHFQCQCPKCTIEEKTGKWQTSGLINLPLAYHFVIDYETKTCRLPHLNPTILATVASSKSLNFDGEVGETWSKDALTRAWKKEICLKMMVPWW